MLGIADSHRGLTGNLIEQLELPLVKARRAREYEGRSRPRILRPREGRRMIERIGARNSS